VPETPRFTERENPKPKPLALVKPYIPTGEPLVTPDQTDLLKKQEQSNNRRAYATVKKRAKAVATDPEDNGISALTAELQNETNGVMRPVAAVTNPPVPAQRKRKPKTAAPVVPTIVPVPTGPPQKKCEGCVHGDVLEMNEMEPTDIKYYLHEGQFLELATCAGDCNNTIRDIYLASPRANLRYCNMTSKGFYAPDDDPTKSELQCGLILCTPCYAIREARYAVANSSGGSGTIRRSRRRT
jgi:hypothetical protein